MTTQDLIRQLNELVLSEMKEYREQAKNFGPDSTSQRKLLRSLMNVRSPAPFSAEFVELQDALLSQEREEKGVVDPMALPSFPGGRIALWQGDITRLAADAIVNAANSALLGCFHPCHDCIDNAIHSAAGLQLREECAAIMAKQGHPEGTGTVKATRAYNLPSRFVFHTVGPIVSGPLAQRHRDALKECYTACLCLAEEMGLKSIAFCCISTGEFRFPPEEAARIAIRTVRDFLTRSPSVERIVFNVFKDSDREIYERMLAIAGRST
ncbi:MAG: hypothetical protein A2Y38_04855 [Spirochaetes bacterium GWB1_59_5]|nr:MAG: hypothetical protein A2Y38_04855 [Spirochaetes bacterium GWB1_59_5]